MNSKDLIVIDYQKYGLDEKKADVIAESFREPLAILAELETEYKQFENLTGEPPQSTCEAAKALKQKYVKVRTSTAAIHKDEKAYFLNAGRYVDAFKNRGLEIGKEREDKLSEIADYYVNIEKARIAELGEERAKALLACELDDEMYIPPNLGEMPEEAWKIYLAGVQKAYDEEMEHRRQEQLRHEAEEKAREEENERIRKENERLQKEAEKREKELQKERAEQEKKLAAERAEREKAEQERLKLEQEKAEMKAAAEKEKAEEEERQRKAAAAPDKEKIKQAIDYISSFPLIKVETMEAQEIIEYAESKLKELSTWMFKEMQEL